MLRSVSVPGRLLAVAVVALVALGVASCARTLPEQDLRIVSATPQEKLTAEILWKDYHADRAAADRQHHGKVMLVTGTVTGFERTGAKFVMFGQGEAAESAVPATATGVQANLLTDTADGILASVQLREKMMLKCYCEGLSGNVILKSCTKP